MENSIQPVQDFFRKSFGSKGKLKHDIFLSIFNQF